MKIAVCLANQPRSYEFTARNIRETFEHSGVSVDYYIHTWVREEGTNLQMRKKIYSSKELRKSLETLYPNSKDIVIEDYLEVPGSTVSVWEPQIYSVSRAVQLALDSKISYDLIFYLRLDSYRAEDLTGKTDYKCRIFPYPNMREIKDNTLYGFQRVAGKEWCNWIPVIQDMQYWGKPESMRVIAEMYSWYHNWLMHVDNYRIEPDPIIEHVWALYLTYRGIQVVEDNRLAVGIPIRVYFEGENIDLYSREGISYIAKRGNRGWDFDPSQKVSKLI